MGRETRSDQQVFEDMVADDATETEIHRRLGWSKGLMRQRYTVMCGRLGEQPDRKFT